MTATALAYLRIILMVNNLHHGKMTEQLKLKKVVFLKDWNVWSEATV